MRQADKILVQDACILIDLIELDLIDEFFELNYSVVTTRNVIFEITDDTQFAIAKHKIDSGKLVIRAVADEGVFTLNAKHPRLSLADCSVLELGSTVDGKVLTADGTLRKTCIHYGIKVGGLLWVIRQLVRDGRIRPNRGIEALDQYLKINAWPAPKSEIKKLRTDFENLNHQR